MKNLNEVCNLNDFKEIYNNLGFKASLVKEEDRECILLCDDYGSPLYLVYASMSVSPLNYDDVKDILIDLELDFNRYNCNNYIVISKHGYSNKSSFIDDESLDVYNLEHLNIKLEGAEYIEELIKASSSDEKYFELNAHNKIAYSNIKQAFANGENKVYVRHATGTGKSILTSKYILNECRNNILLLSSSSTILDQFKEHLNSYDSSKMKLMTYNKLSQIDKYEFELLEDFNPELIVLDEFHRCGARTWGESVNKLLEASTNAKVLGTSATPVRYLDNARHMGEEIFDGNIVSSIDLCEAIVRGILPMPTYVTAMYDFEDTLDNLSKSLAESSCSQVEKVKTSKKIEALSSVSKSSTLIKSTFNKHIGNKRNFIVFCKNIIHMKNSIDTVNKWFDSYIEENNLDCKINTYELHSYILNNQSVVDDFKYAIENNPNNDFNVLFAVDMISEGLHSKNLDGVILLRPTKSPIVYYQQIGRALQVNSNNKPVIFDFVNNADYIQTQSFITQLTEAFDEVDNSTNNTLSKVRNIDILLSSIYDETKDIVSVLTDIEDSIKVEWDLMFEELERFKKIRGTIIVRPSDNQKLSKWCTKNRYLYLSGNLSSIRKEKLDSIGFVVSVQDALWLGHYEDLKDYKRIHGHIDVTSEDNPKLHIFIKAQRRLNKEGKLPRDRFELLDKLGMTWDVREHKWESNYLKLVDIYNKIGLLSMIENDPIIVTKEQTIIIDESLMDWIKKQRKSHTDGNLTEERKNKLTSLGLYLNLAQKTWDDNMNNLKLFIQINNHSNVSPEDGKQLYNWVRRLRKLKGKNELAEDIVKELDSIGFSWSIKDTRWEECFVKYLDYVKKYKTVLMEKSCEGYDAEIDRWIGSQRKAYKEGKMTEYRFNKLNSLGFIWDVLEYNWFKIYNEIKELMNLVGVSKYDSKILSEYTGDTPIASWIGTQRKAYKNNKLSDERFKLLTDIGIYFNV